MVHKQKLVQTPGESEPDTMEQYHYHNILFGGTSSPLPALGGHKGSASILNLRRGNWRGLFHVSKIGIPKSFCLRYINFSCFNVFTSASYDFGVIHF